MSDFLIEFTVDGRQAIQMMDQLGQMATALEARLNALGQGTVGGGAGVLGVTPAAVQQTTASVAALTSQVQNLQQAATSSAGGITSGGTVLGISPSAIQQTNASVAALTARVESLRAASATRVTLGLPETSAQLRTQAIATQQLANALGTTHPLYAQLSAEASVLTQRSTTLSSAIRNSTGVFGTHVARIAEGILVYQGFAKAVQALSSGVGTIIDIDRESRRLQAVLGTTATQTQEQVRQIGQIASNTVTSFTDLVGGADQISAAFLDVEDPAKRAADALKLTADVGKITSVTQRDVATETDNLTAILKQSGIDINNFGDVLGKIVIAGGNSSTVIARLLDALQGSAQAARFFNVFKEGGQGIETLLALESQFIIETGRTGTSVGDTFKTMFAKITNPEAEAAITKLTNGVVKLRDSTGQLRSPIDILVDLNAQAQAGIITAAQLNDVLSKIAPPLNPGAKSDLVLIAETLQRIGPLAGRIAGAGESDLNKLVDQINSALGPQFQKLLIDAQVGLVNLFGGSNGTVVQDGKILLTIIRDIGGALGSIPAPVLQTIANIIALVTAFRLLVFAGREIGAVLGVGGLLKIFNQIVLEMKSMQLAAAGGAADLTVLNAAAVTTNTTLGTTTGTSTAAAGGITVLGGASAETAGEVEVLGDAEVATEVKTGLLATTSYGAAAAFKVLGGAALTLLARLGPLLAIMAAIDAIQFGQDVAKQSEQLGGKVGGLAEGTSLAALQQLRDKLSEASRKEVTNQILQGGPLGAFGAGVASIGLSSNIDKLDKLIAKLKSEGAGATVTLQDLKDVGLDPAAAAADSTTQSINDQVSALQKQIDAAIAAASAQKDLSQADKDAALATEINNNLADERVATIKKLDTELQKGKISLSEHAAGIDQVNKVSDTAAKLTALLGSKLGLIPELAAAATQGNDKLAAALYNLFLTGGKNIDVLLQQATALIVLAQAQHAAADSAAAHPIVITTIFDAQVTQNARDLRGGFSSGIDQTGQVIHRTNTTGTTTTSSAGADAELLAAIKSLGDAFTQAQRTSGGSLGSTFGTSGSARQQVPIFDIGDLPPDQLKKLIAIATTLRNQIPGETAADKNDLIAVIKDAKLLQTVRGIDERLLRIALDELTKQIKDQTDLMKQQQLQTLRNIQTQVGPLGALISQPTLFGVGGNIALGNGLNIDPNSGQVIINVAVDGKTLTDAQLAQAIANAIQNALRSG